MLRYSSRPARVLYVTSLLMCVCVCVDLVAHYELPMDAVDNDGYIENPSSLHAVLRGSTTPQHSSINDDDDDDVRSAVTDGIDRHAVRLVTSHSYIHVDTSTLKTECFGDLRYCHAGQSVTQSCSPMYILAYDTLYIVVVIPKLRNSIFMGFDVLSDTNKLPLCLHTLCQTFGLLFEPL